MDEVKRTSLAAILPLSSLSFNPPRLHASCARQASCMRQEVTPRREDFAASLTLG
jgi:hypothetical protein